MLTDLHAEIGVAAVEGKQSLRGESSTNWELDAVAWLEGGERFLGVEARRNTKARQKQEALAALAGHIRDLDAAGGVIVSPLPLQSGANVSQPIQGLATYTFFTNSDFNPIWPIPSIMQSMSWSPSARRMLFAMFPTEAPKDEPMISWSENTVTMSPFHRALKLIP